MFSPNGLLLNFCQDFFVFLCIFYQKDDIPLKTQQPTPWNLCCLMRGIQCFSHNEGDLVCSLNEMGFSTLPIRKLSSICCFIFRFCSYFFHLCWEKRLWTLLQFPKTSPWVHLGLMWGFFIYLREDFFNHHNFFQKSLGLVKGCWVGFLWILSFRGFSGLFAVFSLFVEDTKTLLWAKKIRYISLH